MNWMLNLIFWVLLVADTFSGCYFIVSKLGTALTQITPLPSTAENVLVVILSLVLTPIVLKVFFFLFRREMADQAESQEQILSSGK